MTLKKSGGLSQVSHCTRGPRSFIFAFKKVYLFLTVQTELDRRNERQKECIIEDVKNVILYVFGWAGESIC